MTKPSEVSGLKTRDPSPPGVPHQGSWVGFGVCDAGRANVAVASGLSWTLLSSAPVGKHTYPIHTARCVTAVCQHDLFIILCVWFYAF